MPSLCGSHWGVVASSSRCLQGAPQSQVWFLHPSTIDIHQLYIYIHIHIIVYIVYLYIHLAYTLVSLVPQQLCWEPGGTSRRCEGSGPWPRRYDNEMQRPRAISWSRAFAPRHMGQHRCPKFPLVGWWIEGCETTPEIQQVNDGRWYTSHRPLYDSQKDMIGRGNRLCTWLKYDMILLYLSWLPCSRTFQVAVRLKKNCYAIYLPDKKQYINIHKNNCNQPLCLHPRCREHTWISLIVPFHPINEDSSLTRNALWNLQISIIKSRQMWILWQSHSSTGSGKYKCPVLGILNITFKYLLDMIYDIPNSWVMFD